MKVDSYKALILICVFFYAIACKQRSKESDLQNRFTSPDTPSCQEDPTKTVADCFKHSNSADGSHFEVQYKQDEYDDSMKALFSRHPFLIKSRFPDGTKSPSREAVDRCLGVDKETNEVSWVFCHNEQFEKRFYFARRESKTTVKTASASEVSYKDSIFQIMPVNATHHWLEGGTLKCLGINSQSLSTKDTAMSMKDGHSIKNLTIELSSPLQLGQCRKSGFLSHFISIPNSLSGDNSVYMDNKFGLIALIDRKRHLNNSPPKIHNLCNKAPCRLGDKMRLTEFYFNHVWGDAPDEPLDVDIDLTKIEPYKWENCKIFGLSPLMSEARFTCLNQLSVSKRDLLSTPPRMKLGKYDWQKSHKINTIYLEECEGVATATNTLPSCDTPNRIRSMAELSTQIDGFVIQIRDKNHKDDKCYHDTKKDFITCPQNEDGTQYLMTTNEVDDGEVASSEEDAVSVNFPGFDYTIRPLQMDKLDGSECLHIEGPNKITKKERNCAKARAFGDRLLLPKSEDINLFDTQPIKSCINSVNLTTGVSFDCHDYVPPRLKRLLRIADILSNIPILGFIPSAVLYNQVCQSNEMSLYQQGCLGLAIGLPIDAIFLPFDIGVSRLFARHITKYATGLKKGVVMANIKSAFKGAPPAGFDNILENASKGLTPQGKRNLRSLVSRLGKAQEDKIVKFVDIMLTKLTPRQKRMADFILKNFLKVETISKQEVDTFVRNVMPNGANMDSFYKAIIQRSYLTDGISELARNEVTREFLGESLGLSVGLSITFKN